MLISIMPLLLLSFILPAVLSIFGISNWFIIFLCIINAGGSCVDVLNMFLIAGQVLQNGTIVNNGYSTYFKNAEQPIAVHTAGLPMSRRKEAAILNMSDG